MLASKEIECSCVDEFTLTACLDAGTHRMHLMRMRAYRFCTARQSSRVPSTDIDGRIVVAETFSDRVQVLERAATCTSPLLIEPPSPPFAFVCQIYYSCDTLLIVEFLAAGASSWLTASTIACKFSREPVPRP